MRRAYPQIILTPESSELLQSRNSRINQLRAENWLVPIEPTQTSLFSDIRRNTHLETETLIAEVVTDNEAWPFFSRLNFQQQEYEHIKECYNQGIYSLWSGSLCSEHQTVTVKSSSANIFKNSQGQIFCEVSTENYIAIPRKMDIDPEDRLSIPGRIRTLYQLMNEGFVLKEVEFSNGVLKALCLQETPLILPQHIEYLNFAAEHTEQEILADPSILQKAAGYLLERQVWDHIGSGSHEFDFKLVTYLLENEREAANLPQLVQKFQEEQLDKLTLQQRNDFEEKLKPAHRIEIFPNLELPNKDNDSDAFIREMLWTDLLNLKLETENELREYFAKAGFTSAQYELIKHHFHQDLHWELKRLKDNLLQMGFFINTQDMKTQANIFISDSGNIYLDYLYSFFPVQDPKTMRSVYLPGYIKQRNQLTTEGFKEIHAEFSNSLLCDLCCGDPTTLPMITLEVAESAQKQEDYVAKWFSSPLLARDAILENPNLLEEAANYLLEQQVWDHIGLADDCLDLKLLSHLLETKQNSKKLSNLIQKFMNEKFDAGDHEHQEFLLNHFKLIPVDILQNSIAQVNKAIKNSSVVEFYQNHYAQLDAEHRGFLKEIILEPTFDANAREACLQIVGDRELAFMSFTERLHNGRQHRSSTSKIAFGVTYAVGIGATLLGVGILAGSLLALPFGLGALGLPIGLSLMAGGLVLCGVVGVGHALSDYNTPWRPEETKSSAAEPPDLELGQNNLDNSKQLAARIGERGEKDRVQGLESVRNKKEKAGVATGGASVESDQKEEKVGDTSSQSEESEIGSSYDSSGDEMQTSKNLKPETRRLVEDKPNVASLIKHSILTQDKGKQPATSDLQHLSKQGL